MNRAQIYTRYIAGAVVFSLFTILNHYHKELLPRLPDEVILAISIVALIWVSYWLMRHELDVDNLKYQFLTIATHKFRTPLTAIKWITESLAKEITHDDKINYLRQLDVSVNRIMEVVDILTGLARFDHKMQYAYETAWLRQMIDVALDKYVPNYKEKNISFSITADPEIPLVVLDKRKIQFVIDTLFENAIRYSPVGSKIDVILHNDGEYVILTVKDAGFGMTRKDISNLFRRFWRSEDSKRAFPDGMGLALAMSHEIMKKHGGRIWAESKGKNLGTSFFLKLRIADVKPKKVTLNKVEGI
ncbi:MAG: HAMP domain-containing histidine kinase [Candidatus Taylorbacteria bacterium]|nr:HAMP domain-containing histidine kinase [Candidatus Taylorbacteria bacterium]